MTQLNSENGFVNEVSFCNTTRKLQFHLNEPFFLPSCMKILPGPDLGSVGHSWWENKTKQNAWSPWNWLQFTERWILSGLLRLWKLDKTRSKVNPWLLVQTAFIRCNVYVWASPTNAEFLEWLYPWTQHPGVVFVLPLGSCATTAESLTRHWSPHLTGGFISLIFELVYSSPSILLTHMMGESETYETMKKSLPNALLQNML